MLDSLAKVDIPEIAAGSMQLQPVDEQTRPGAVAALGAAIRTADAVWVARDAVTALPRAYVALVCRPHPRVCAAPGLDGSSTDADDAAQVVRRYAKQAIGITPA